MKLRSHSAQLLSALAIASLAALSASCTSSSDGGGETTVKKVPAVAPSNGSVHANDFDHTAVKPGVVQSSQEQSDAVEVQPDRLVFPASAAAEVAKQWPMGAPVVGNRQSAGVSGTKNPFGYLRKVKGIQTEGDTVVVLTEPAMLGDVLTGDAYVSVDPHAVIPIDTTGIDLTQYFPDQTGIDPTPLPMAGADAGAAEGGAGDAGDAGDAGPMPIRRPGVAKGPSLAPGLRGPVSEVPFGPPRRPLFGLSTIGSWASDAYNAGSSVVDTATSAAAGVLAGVPGLPIAYDVSKTFHIGGPIDVFHIDKSKAKKHTYKTKKGDVTVEISGDATLNGSIDFDPKFSVSVTLGIAPDGVQALSASAAGDLAIKGVLQVTTNVTLASGSKATDAVDLQTLLNQGPEVGSVPPVLLLQSPAYAGPLIGGIPTTFQLQLWGDCNFGIQGTVQATATGALAATNASAEVDYDGLQASWSSKASFPFQSQSSFQLVGGGGVTVKCGLRPQVNWLFADVGGPYLGIHGSVTAHAAYVESCDPKAKKSGPADGDAKLGIDGNVDVLLGGSLRGFTSSTIGIGPFTIDSKSFPDLIPPKEFQFPKKGIGYCQSLCDDGVQDGDEGGVDCSGSICDLCGKGAACGKPADCATGFCVGGVCVDHCHNGTLETSETDVDRGGPDCKRCGEGQRCYTVLDCAAGVCLPNTFVCGSACVDGQLDLGETDVDCGGPCTTHCALGKKCNTGGDCDTGVCDDTTHLCILTPCADGVKDRGESDVDCGHVCSTQCTNGKSCLLDGDCASTICAAYGSCVASRCQDGIFNGTETDLDCGGPSCGACYPGGRCNGPSDCLSALCNPYSHRCATNHCDDGLKDADEVGVDCGGATCSACGLGKGCQTGADCASGFCSASGRCVENHCRDEVANAGEVDVDCGGTCPLACGQGKACNKPSDCASGLCSTQTNKCIGNRCLDSVKDGDESDVDCGGTCSARCAVGKACKLASDCVTQLCNQQTGKCAADACSDGVKDGAETDVDCGGGTCAACVNGGACVADTDCQGACGKVSHTCVTNHCFDQIKDADESALDCGGALCAGCQVGVACTKDGDCASGACGATGVCAASKCSDGKLNGTETAIDCGGTCSGCGVGVACASGADCASGACSPGTHLCIAGCVSGVDCATGICNVSGGKCVSSTCQDGVVDGAETAVDCGGGTCSGCAVGAACALPRDCASGACDAIGSTCAVDHCSDHAQTADETGVDCGGALCGACALGVGCKQDTDCLSGACNSSTGVCVADHCADAHQDADESDTDCGGATCGACATGLHCAKATDCASTYCYVNATVCVADHCYDGIVDGGETDRDCGGTCAAKCRDGAACNSGTDCDPSAQDCRGGFCSTPPKQKSCVDWLLAGSSTDGTYVIWAPSIKSEVPVYCDMTDGAWTLAWLKTSNSAQHGWENQGTTGYQMATSQMGTGFLYNDWMASEAPIARSLTTEPYNDITGDVDLRASNPNHVPYTYFAFVRYENGVVRYNALNAGYSYYKASDLLLDWGVPGMVIAGKVFCRGVNGLDLSSVCYQPGYPYTVYSQPTGIMGDGVSMFDGFLVFQAGIGVNAGFASAFSSPSGWYFFANAQTTPYTNAQPGAGVAVALWVR